jgi:hypothetical protein
MVTTMWLKTWNLTDRLANPPNALNFPTKLAYLHTYAINMAYITPPDQTETIRCFHQRIYNPLHIMTMAQQNTRGMLIETQHPAIPWLTVWRNLHAVWTSEDIKSVKFLIIHDLIPTNDRLAKINLNDTPRCTRCDRKDTLLHRLAECNEETEIWRWTRLMMTIILRIDPTTHSPGLDHPSEFSLLATSKACRSSVDPRPYGVLHNTTPGKSIVRRLCRLHAASPLQSISHRTPACKSWKLPEDDITNRQSPPECASRKPCRETEPLHMHTLSDISSSCLHAKDKHFGLVALTPPVFEYQEHTSN